MFGMSDYCYHSLTIDLGRLNMCMCHRKKVDKRVEREREVCRGKVFSELAWDIIKMAYNAEFSCVC